MATTNIHLRSHLTSSGNVWSFSKSIHYTIFGPRIVLDFMKILKKPLKIASNYSIRGARLPSGSASEPIEKLINARKIKNVRILFFPRYALKWC